MKTCPTAVIEAYRPVKVTAAGRQRCREWSRLAGARCLREARRPVLHAGPGRAVRRGRSDDLLEAGRPAAGSPVMNHDGSQEARSPEDHPLGAPAPVARPVTRAQPCSNLPARGRRGVSASGCSFTRPRGWRPVIPAGKTLIHATNDERDLNTKNYALLPTTPPSWGTRATRAAAVHRGRQGPWEVAPQGGLRKARRR